MPERDIGIEILNGIREIKAHKAGENTLCNQRLKNLLHRRKSAPNLNYPRRHLPG
jgi:hypothetical protein